MIQSHIVYCYNILSYKRLCPHLPERADEDNESKGYSIHIMKHLHYLLTTQNVTSVFVVYFELLHSK